MKRLLVLLVAITGLLLSGCADNIVSPELNSEAHVPLTCANKQQCDLYWSRAQIWISDHSFFRIQTVTDTVLNTYGPDQYNHISWQLARIPNADGSARIKITPNCDIQILCVKQVYQDVVSLKEYVRSGS